jgi:hypothetical protein
LAGTVVERRQASAPDSGRVGASRPCRGATAPAGAGLTTVRLPAFRFLISFVLDFVIASEAKQSSFLQCRSGLLRRYRSSQ